MADAATAEEESPMPATEEELGIEYDEERLEAATEVHEIELEERHEGDRVSRFRDLDGKYRKPEATFDWGPEDKLARQLAAVAEWPTKEVRKFREELAEINEDGRLSEKGEREKKEQLAREYLEADSGGSDRGGRLVRTGHDVDRLAKRVDTAAPDFRVAPEPDPGDAVSAVREMELRNYLRTLEGDDLERTRRAWAHGEDPTKVRAVFGGDPGMAGFATEQGREALRQEVIREKYGNLPDQVEALRGLADLARHNLQEARREIARLGGLEE